MLVRGGEKECLLKYIHACPNVAAPHVLCQYVGHQPLNSKHKRSSPQSLWALVKKKLQLPYIELSLICQMKKIVYMRSYARRN